MQIVWPVSTTSSTWVASVPPTSGSNAASDGLDYARTMIDEVGTGLESAFESITTSGLADGAGVALPEVGLGLTADLVGLEPLGFATALMLGMYASGWVALKVAQIFPNPSVFGWHPLGFINQGLNDMGQQWEKAALDVIDPVAHWFMQPIRQVIGMFQRVGNATASAHNKVATVVNSTIPLSVSDGITRAEAYVTLQVDNIKTQLDGAVSRLSGHVTEAQAKVFITDAAKYGGVGWDVTAVAASAIVSADEFATTLANQANDNLKLATAKVATDAQAALDTLHAELIKQLTGDENALAALSTTVNVTLPASVAAQVARVQATEAKALSESTTRLQSEIDTITSQITALNQRITSD